MYRTEFGGRGGLSSGARLLGVDDQEILRLLPSAAAAVTAGVGAADGYLARLGSYDEQDQAQVDRCLRGFLVGLIRSSWERGWAPADVVQHGRRKLEAGAEPLLLAVIAAEHRSYKASTLDPRWRDQLADFSISTPFADLDLTGWAATQRLGRYLTLHTSLALAGFLQTLPALARLFPLPGTAHHMRAGSAPPADQKILARIRALLAKAEGTEFPEEAEALSAKAQELMAKFSLDQALVEAAPSVEIPDDSGARRIWVETPYVSAKAQLVGAVANANRCRTVSLDQLAVVTVVGAELDLHLTELLATSLLVQANRAMLAAGKHLGRRGESRTRSFRQSFLMAYAHRIGERLEAATTATQAAVSAADRDRLLPVLTQRDHQVEALFTKLFPQTTTRRTRITNGEGWHAGLTAANQATLPTHPNLTP
ncbi:uncharacterized protein DUF2786 [Kribbella sp. VKM Ac-2527]|uniref:Uncharacterized protein DUF2786 n=1 Tax=Kribbella caucasensis TaxID=2512215 RepID=A0A4R6JHY9_9ACTN|nr:DUF2786 domain-containing protein [Kribbella sp. VKM Ac-2527]TDO35730.1 uncharacterized protein DUF2786 [Kribbella sp. VKM Ac-2527]